MADAGDNRRSIVTATLNRIATDQFSYGQMDCCLVASEVIKAITGFDYASRFPYHSEDSAKDILDEYGGLSGLFSFLFGEPMLTGFNVGDPVLIKLNNFEMIGIFMGDTVYAKTERGMLPVPISRIKEGWSIA